MKARLLLFALLIASPAFARNEDLQGLGFNSAVKFLAANKFKVNGALLEGWWQSARMSEEEAAKHKLINGSMDAIETIHVSHKKVALSILIPFLGVTGDGGLRDMFGSPRVLSPAVVALQRRDTWPAYAVILDMPDSAGDLEKFSLDRNNAFDGRLEAFQILAELDQVRSKKVADRLESEIAANPSLKDRGNILEFIEGVEAGGFPFEGPREWQITNGLGNLQQK